MLPTFLKSLPAALLLTTLAPCAAPAVTTAPPLPLVTARLTITYAGNGYYLVAVVGQSSARNASVGVRVYGDDPWFDDYLFHSFPGLRTDINGNFGFTQMVPRSMLNEDWEGTDEIFAIAEVSGDSSVRTNTISRSF